MLAPAVSVYNKVFSVLWQLYSYQLGFLVSASICGSPAIILIVILWPEMLPALIASATGFIIAHCAIIFSDIQEGQIDPPSEHKFRLSITELGALLSVMSIYVSSVFLLGVAADVVAVMVFPPALVWAAGITPLADILLLRQFSLSPAAIPMLAVLYLLHGLGLLTRIDADDVARYGQRGRAI